MPRLPHLARLSLALAGAGAVLGLSAVPAHAISPVPPRVVAHPDNVMVNTTFRVTGTGFAPGATLVVKECSTTSWVVTEHPCASNAVTVHVTPQGTFRHSMVAKVCPAATPSPGFVQLCYVGVPKPSGVDTVTLVGAGQLTITGP